MNNLTFTRCQNILIEKIINDFCPRFTFNSHIIYVGDTDEKFAYSDKSALWKLGIKIDTHGKMPDIIIHKTSRYAGNSVSLDLRGKRHGRF
jgi:hypothetical protein